MKPYHLLLCLLLAPLASVWGADPKPTNDPKPKLTNDFTGTWHWTFKMPDGTEASPKLKLKQEGAKLTGTSILRSGTAAAITNGAVAAGEARFEVVRQHHGITVTTRYAGKLDGDVVRGRVESDWAGTAQSYPWEARRFAGIEGTWKWSVPFGSRTIESRLTLQLDGDKLTGTMPGREGRPPTPIKNASFKDNEVAFEVERGRGDFKFLSKFQGTLEGDTIQGEIETFINNEPRTNDWDAVRVE